jgi:predicted amidohydrolase
MKHQVYFNIYLYLLISLFFIVGCTDKKTVMTNEKPLRNYKLAMIQMKVDAGDLEANLNRAWRKIAVASANGAKIALLPEAMDLGWTDPSAREKAYEIPDGMTCRKLREAAVEHDIYVCAGIIEKAGANTFNAAVIINPSGEVILHHRKIHELDIAHDLYDLGDRLNVVRSPLGTLGLYICADATAPENALSTSLGLLGADIILSPCAWAVPPDFDNEVTPYGDTWRNVYEPASSRFEMWVIGVSNVGKIEAGPWKDWNCIGSSLVFGPDGSEVLQAPFGAAADTIIYVDVKLKDRPAWGTKWYDYWQSKTD